jgi:molybdopterin-guanine dinucleotide biosynthesis protein A
MGVRKEALEGLKRRLESGDRSVHGFVEAEDAEIIEGMDASIFPNINSEEDYLGLLAADDTDSAD